MNDIAAATARALTHDDLLPPAEYALRRPELRQAIVGIKRRRRVEVGPCATFHFENRETVRRQIQEMLHIEKGGDAQVEDELAAYNPLIPQGRELVATVMIEIDDPARRAATLARLGGVENQVFIDIADERVRGAPDPTRENTSPEGKASAVQFLRFALTAGQIAKFKTEGARVVAGFDHPFYAHMAVLPEEVRAALAEDFDAPATA